MSDAKTRPTGVPVEEFIAAVEPERRRREAAIMLDLMARATGFEPLMWGPSIIGYGRYPYTYSSGHSGEWPIAAFSPRKAQLVVYVMPGFDAYATELAALGPHAHSVSCLYLKRLDAVDLAVLERIVTDSVARMKERYPGWRA
ncbi:MAG: DUF1801 domain-containing protein [Rhizobiaceae bacterium]